MNIPNKVRIGGIDYDIQYEEKLLLDGQQCYGVIDKDKTIIKIDPNLQTEQFKCQTFLHEVLHGIAKHFSLKDLDDNEEMIDQIAKGLYMVIADNPGMFKD